MTKVSVSKKDLQKFLLSFGKGLPDVRLSCSGARITAEIAYASFYLRKSLTVMKEGIIEEGTLHIADLQKLLKFIKAAKSDFIQLRQTATDKPLHAVSGGNKLQLPSTNLLESVAKVPVIRKLLNKGVESGWETMGSVKFTAHGTIDATDLTALAEMRTLVSKESNFIMRMHTGESEFGIVAGKAASGRLFTTLPITNAEGPNATVQSHFGEWLPSCLEYLDEVPVRVHMGDSTLAVFEQANTLMMVVDLAED
tara:strand:- start:9284 stop:10042 length:759 start_codon:yes stop_codon:yes gene_type:complete